MKSSFRVILNQKIPIFLNFFQGFSENMEEKNSLSKSAELPKDHSETIDQKNYFEYTVEQDDTLIGIAIKFDLNVQVLETINTISEGNIYPNQVFYLL